MKMKENPLNEKVRPNFWPVVFATNIWYYYNHTILVPKSIFKSTNKYNTSKWNANMKLDELDNCKNEIKLAQMKLLLFCLFAYHAPRWPCGAWGAARWDTEGARPPCPGTCWASLFSAPRNIHSQRSEGRRCSNAVKNEDSFALHDLQNHWNHI